MRIKNFVKQLFFMTLVIFMALGTSEVFAACHDKDMETAADSEHQGTPHSMSMAHRPLQSADLQGLKVSLDVMDMGMHVHMQGMKGNPVPDSYDAKRSQAIMFMIQSAATKETVKDAEVTVTITSPSGKKTIRRAPWCGDHYGQSFSPAEEGTYRIAFRTNAKEGNGEIIFNYVYKNN